MPSKKAIKKKLKDDYIRYLEYKTQTLQISLNQRSIANEKLKQEQENLTYEFLEKMDELREEKIKTEKSKKKLENDLKIIEIEKENLNLEINKFQTDINELELLVEDLSIKNQQVDFLTTKNNQLLEINNNERKYFEFQIKKNEQEILDLQKIKRLELIDFSSTKSNPSIFCKFCFQNNKNIKMEFFEEKYSGKYLEKNKNDSVLKHVDHDFEDSFYSDHSLEASSYGKLKPQKSVPINEIIKTIEVENFHNESFSELLFLKSIDKSIEQKIRDTKSPFIIIKRLHKSNEISRKCPHKFHVTCHAKVFLKIIFG